MQLCLSSTLAILRSGYRPSAATATALRAEVAGDTGAERVDSAGPAETAALMAALARLSGSSAGAWGDAEVWSRLGEAALAQVSEDNTISMWEG